MGKRTRRPRRISRREFTLTAAAAMGGLGVGFGLTACGARPHGRRPTQAGEIRDWIVVAPDNTVVIRIAYADMGQGTPTTMVQLLAEELDVDWSTIRTEFISLKSHVERGRVYGRTEASASLAVRSSDPDLRTAGAQIRAMLVTAAAQRLNTPESELTTERGVVTHTRTGASLTYGELAAAAAELPVPDAASLRLKSPEQWKYLGTSVRRLDVPSKATGTAVYGADVTLPGMKHAAIAVCPVFGGKLASYDPQPALAHPGVLKVVEIADSMKGTGRPGDAALAVVADGWWQAQRALDAMPRAWDGGRAVTTDSAAILASLRTGLDGDADQVLRNEGDVERALAQAARTLQADYFVPYLEQATMEPMNCTALVTDDRFEVWAPTQHPEDALRVAAAVTKLPETQGEVHVPAIGCGFGRRTESDFVSQAVQIAQAMKGVPVKLLWSREQTTQHGFYRQASLSRLRGGLDANGRLVAWHHRLSAQSTNAIRSTYGADFLLFSVPNMKVDRAVRPSHVPEGAMRGVGYSMNGFLTQSFVDELAHEARADPYRFQRDLLDPTHTPTYVPQGELDPELAAAERASRLRAVLDTAVARSGWSTSLGRNRGRGIAIQEQQGAYYALVAEVTLDGKGWLTIDRIVVVGDIGQLAHPDNARAQVEGSVAFGLTSALFGEITIAAGRVEQSNFHDYRMLRMREMPEVDVHWIGERRFWGDVSQAVIGIVAPAVTNGIFAAGGPRVRSLPIRNHQLFLRG